MWSCKCISLALIKSVEIVHVLTQYQVYCNKCYQSRKPDTKSTSKNLFPEVQSGARKVPLCAVDDCTSEVGDKKFWVGVFM